MNNGGTKSLSPGWYMSLAGEMLYCFGFDDEAGTALFVQPQIDIEDPEHSYFDHGKIAIDHIMHVPPPRRAGREDLTDLCHGFEQADAYKRWWQTKQVFNDVVFVPLRREDGTLIEQYVTFDDDAEVVWMLANRSPGSHLYHRVATDGERMLRSVMVRHGYFYPVASTLDDASVDYVILQHDPTPSHETK